MKRTITSIITIVLISAIGYFSFHKYRQSTSPLRKADQYISSGQIQNAFDKYTEALIKISPAIKVPDFNKSKVVSPSIWKKDLIKYVEWICLPSPVPEDFNRVVDIINKYRGDYDRSGNKIVNLTTKPFLLTSFVNEWKSAFYAPTVEIDSSHLQIASGAHFRNISFLKLSADKGFTYEVNLVNLSTGKQTSYTVFSEGSKSVLVYPGDYLILCKSNVAFSSGEIWKSSNTVIPITIPQTPSIVTGILITKIQRQKS